MAHVLCLYRDAGSILPPLIPEGPIGILGLVRNPLSGRHLLAQMHAVVQWTNSAQVLSDSGIWWLVYLLRHIMLSASISSFDKIANLALQRQ